jgi:hypothetical protein
MFPLSHIDRFPLTIRSCQFDDPGTIINFARDVVGFIVTATHTTNRWTEFNPENEGCNWEIFGKISLKGKKPKPKKLSYALVVISDSPIDEQDKSSEWRRIGVAVIDHEMLSESPEVVKVK